MIENNNDSIAFNNFIDVPKIPYKVIETMLLNNSQSIEDFWKLLKYPTVDCLDKDNLTFEEKKALIWNGDTLESNYNVFFKPLIGSSTDNAESQTQLRIYRTTIYPTNRLEAVVCFEADFLTNEKTCLVYKDNMLLERTDLMETYFLNFMNGRDIDIGSGYFSFDKQMSRSCDSQIGLSNSKSFFGRSIILGLNYMNDSSDRKCL